MKSADLHIHTFFSDGTQSPQEVIADALKGSLACIAITDHDTVDGISPTIESGKEKGIEVLAGIELSSEINQKDVHILGYLFDFENPTLNKKLGEFQSVRIKRITEMLEKLKAFGIDNITIEEVCALTHSRSVGRPHLASLLVQKGWVGNMRQAFDKYLALGAPAYVPKFEQTPYEAIALIRQMNGVAVLAHPMLTGVDELIPAFVSAGLKGIEVYYPWAAQSTVDFYSGIAKKHGLVATGGSDAHGDAKRHTHIGKQTVPYEVVEQLKEIKGK